MFSGQNLANFGLQSVNEGSAGEELNTSKLRDVVNIHLVMQSEFLRRLALCLSPDLRSDSRSLALGQDLGHMSHTCEDIRLQLDTNCHQLRLCLRYNQALGCGDNTGNMSKVNKITSSCSDLHPSLKSGCLHLQNCLLKLREIETSDLDIENSSGLPDIKENLQEVMNELTVCQEAVQESFEIVSNILNPESKICKIQREIVDSTKDEQDGNITLITEGKEIERYDEVFEAFIKASDLTILDHDDKEDIQEVKVKLKESKQTKKVLRELKSVLVGKQLEWKVKEEKALARKNGDNLSIETKTEDVKNESLELQQKMKAESESVADGEKSKADLKAERRAKQEAQRAAKEAAQKKTQDSKQSKDAKVRVPDEIKADDKKVEKKLNKVLKDQNIPQRTKVQRQVGLFSHLHQYERELSVTKNLSVAGSSIHPAIIQLGLQHAAGEIVGSSGRSGSLLLALKSLLLDSLQQLSASLDLSKEVDNLLKPNLIFLKQCRQLSISMSNSIRYLKRELNS